MAALLVAALSVSAQTCDTVYPWHETFSNGLDCWYRPTGSNWNTYLPSTQGVSYPEQYRCLASYSNSDTLDSWIVSPAIAVPASADSAVTLIWHLCSSNANFTHTYSVMVSTDSDRTALGAYATLYADTSQFSNSLNQYTERRASLAAYAGQVVYIAFRNQPIAWSSYLYIDDVEVRSSCPPVLALEGPTAVQSHEATTYSATLAEGNTAGLVYTWHSTLLDTTWVDSATAATLSIAYTVAGIDTLSVVAANACGADTVTTRVTVTWCPPAGGSWSEDFDAVSYSTYSTSGVVPDCWRRHWGGYTMRAPHVITPANYPQGTLITYNSLSLLMMAGTNPGYDTVALVETPVFADPLNGQSLAFYHMQDNAYFGQLSLGYMQGDLFVPTDTLTNTDSGRTDTVLLNGFPADVHRVALQWKCLSTWHGILLDNMELLPQDTMPAIALTMPTAAYAGDTLAFSARLTGGSTAGLTYTWHSTLLDSTWSGTASDIYSSTSAIIYLSAGTDTVTVTALNAYGSDTATAVVAVAYRPLPRITIAAPDTVLAYEDVVYNASLNSCSRHGMHGLWRSSLTGRTTGFSGEPVPMAISYGFSGIDTLTLIVANTFGADTATALVEVIDCTAQTVPYTQNFDDVNVLHRTLPLCWQSCQWPGASAYAPQVDDNEYYFDTTQSLRLQAGRAVYLDTLAYVVLPGFDQYIWQLQLALDYYNDGPAYNPVTLSVGYVDYDADSSYVALQHLPYTTGFQMLRDTISLAPLLTEQHGQPNIRLAIALHSQDIRSDAFIDNIEVTYNTEQNRRWYVDVASEDLTRGFTRGSGWYDDGANTDIEATALTGYRFAGWHDGDTTNPRRIVVTCDTLFTALFDTIPTTPVDTNTSDTTGIALHAPTVAVSIHPNPSHGDVTVSVGQPSTVSVIDMVGRTVVPPTPVNSTFLIPHSSLPSGAYMVRIVTPDGTAVRRLTVVGRQ